MTNDEIFLLTKEVLDLQEKYDKTHNGLIRDKLRKKQQILKHVIAQKVKPKDEKQSLFEAI